MLRVLNLQIQNIWVWSALYSQKCIGKRKLSKLLHTLLQAWESNFLELEVHVLLLLDHTFQPPFPYTYKSLYIQEIWEGWNLIQWIIFLRKKKILNWKGKERGKIAWIGYIWEKQKCKFHYHHHYDSIYTNIIVFHSSIPLFGNLLK